MFQVSSASSVNLFSFRTSTHSYSANSFPFFVTFSGIKVNGLAMTKYASESMNALDLSHTENAESTERLLRSVEICGICVNILTGRDLCVLCVRIIVTSTLSTLLH